MGSPLLLCRRTMKTQLTHRQTRNNDMIGAETRYHSSLQFSQQPDAICSQRVSTQNIIHDWQQITSKQHIAFSTESNTRPTLPEGQSLFTVIDRHDKTQLKWTVSCALGKTRRPTTHGNEITVRTSVIIVTTESDNSDTQCEPPNYYRN